MLRKRDHSGWPRMRTIGSRILQRTLSRVNTVLPSPRKNVRLINQSFYPHLRFFCFPLCHWLLSRRMYSYMLVPLLFPGALSRPSRIPVVRYIVVFFPLLFIHFSTCSNARIRLPDIFKKDLAIAVTNPPPWRSRENAEGYRRKPRRHDVRGEVWQIQDTNRRNYRRKGNASAKKQPLEKSKKPLEMNVLISEGIGMKTHFHSPN